MDMTFPQYRKNQNGKHFYKINSEIDFEEIQIIGEKYIIMKTLAKIYPDKIRVQEMLHLNTLLYQIISESDFIQALYECKRNKILIHR